MKHVPKLQGEPLKAEACERLMVPPAVDAALRKLARLRKEAAAEIERLLAFLDATDGDSDLEPVLAAPEVRDGYGRRGYVWARGATDDLEDDADDENEHVDDEDDNDDEPSLGSNDGVCQSCWSAGSYDDREGDPGCDDREDVCEDEGSEHDGSESSLGWTDGEAARGLSYAGACGSGYDLEEEHDGREPDVDDEPSIGGDDREDDDAERSGIGDVEGLLEQTEFGGGAGATGFAVAVE